jgi:hypothetical protein
MMPNQRRARDRRPLADAAERERPRPGGGPRRRALDANPRGYHGKLLGGHGSDGFQKRASLSTGQHLRAGEGAPGELFSPTEQYVQSIVTP